MRRHVKLPPKSPSPSPSPSEPKANPPSGPRFEEAVSDRVTLRVPEGASVYLIRAKLAESDYSSLFFLTHKDKLDGRQLEGMVKEAAEVVNTLRIPKRRERMAADKVPIEDPHKINDTLFVGDAEFLEAVLCDKYGFKKLLYGAAEAQILKTIKI